MYKLLVSYIIAYFYVGNVVSRPMAVSELTLTDLQLLQRDGLCLMANFKTSLTFMVQPISTSASTVWYVFCLYICIAFLYLINTYVYSACLSCTSACAVRTRCGGIKALRLPLTGCLSHMKACP